jgi:hypothetical protein
MRKALAPEGAARIASRPQRQRRSASAAAALAGLSTRPARDGRMKAARRGRGDGKQRGRRRKMRRIAATGSRSARPEERTDPPARPGNSRPSWKTAPYSTGDYWRAVAELGHPPRQLRASCKLTQVNAGPRGTGYVRPCPDIFSTFTTAKTCRTARELSFPPATRRTGRPSPRPGRC